MRTVRLRLHVPHKPASDVYETLVGSSILRKGPRLNVTCAPAVSRFRFQVL